jgi:hypothetical protein
MLRPTPAEAILGIQRTLMEVLAPELRSPFAIGQAATAAGVLMAVAMWIDATPKFDAGEIEDLKQTFDSLRRSGTAGVVEAAGYREAINAGLRACDEQPPSRRGMEAAMSELSAGVALGKIAGPVANEVRGYLRRHLERVRVLFGAGSPFG